MDKSTGKSGTAVVCVVDQLSCIAKNYVNEYHTQLRMCLDENGKDEFQLCQNEALKAISLSFQESDTYIIHRINKYKRDGHIFSKSTFNMNYPTVGIVGDSLAAGSLAAGNIEPHLGWLLYNSLIDMLLLNSNPSIPYKDSEPIHPMKDKTYMSPSVRRKNARHGSMKRRNDSSFVTRVFDTPQKSKSGLKRKYENIASSYIECEECVFTYRLAIENQIPPSNIIMAAKGGERIKSLYDQLEKVALPLGHLPEYVFISFTGNDICSNKMENTTDSEKYNQYYQEMNKQLEKSISKIKPSPKGTHIIVVASADITHLINNEDILNKSINYFPKGDVDKEVTCKDIRLGKPTFSKSINNMCSYILNTSPSDEEKISHIKSLHTAIVASQRDIVHQFSQAQKKGFNFYFVDSILDINFQSEDISPDCFHPSAQGHQKIADELSDEVRSIFRDL